MRPTRHQVREWRFADALLKAIQAGDPWGLHESFLHHEKDAGACPDMESLASLGMLADSTELTGTLMICPECGCLLFLPPGPGDREVMYYERRE